MAISAARRAAACQSRLRRARARSETANGKLEGSRSRCASRVFSAKEGSHSTVLCVHPTPRDSPPRRLLHLLSAESRRARSSRAGGPSADIPHTALGLRALLGGSRASAWCAALGTLTCAAGGVGVAGGILVEHCGRSVVCRYEVHGSWEGDLQWGRVCTGLVRGGGATKRRGKLRFTCSSFSAGRGNPARSARP